MGKIIININYLSRTRSIKILKEGDILINIEKINTMIIELKNFYIINK